MSIASQTSLEAKRPWDKKHGWFYLSGRWVQATFIMDHHWHDAITLKLADGQPMITTWDRFVEERPLTEREKQRLEAQERKEEWRQGMIGRLKAELTPEPKRAYVLAKAVGSHPGAVAHYLRNWPEFVGVEESRDGFFFK